MKRVRTQLDDYVAINLNLHLISYEFAQLCYDEGFYMS